jgi:hypothetical protein
MKKRYFLLGLFSLMLLLSACSAAPSLELVKASADIITDESKLGAVVITRGERKGEKMVPTALYYEFIIKNSGNKKIGGYGEKGLEIKIEPSEQLASVSKDVIGFNIFKADNYYDTGLGYGHTFSSVLKPDQEGKFTLHYELGVKEENPEVSLLLPSEERLKQLESHAFNAFLIVTLDNEEIARFNLNEINK